MDDPRATIDIDAPLDRVWATMIDTASYGEWNPFVYAAECAAPAVGEPLVLHVRWPDGRTSRSQEQISVVDPPHDDHGVRRAALAYVYRGRPARLGLVRAVRWQRLSQPPGGPTTYATVAEFTGPLVRLAGPARVADGFRRHAEGLKDRCEQSA